MWFTFFSLFFAHIQADMYISTPVPSLNIFIVLWYLNVWTKNGAGVNHIFFNTSLALVFHIYLFSMLNMLLTVIYCSHIQYNHNIHSTILHRTKLFKKEIILLFYSLPQNPPKCLGFIFIVRLNPDLSQLIIPI